MIQYIKLKHIKHTGKTTLEYLSMSDGVTPYILFKSFPGGKSEETSSGVPLTCKERKYGYIFYQTSKLWYMGVYICICIYIFIFVYILYFYILYIFYIKYMYIFLLKMSTFFLKTSILTFSGMKKRSRWVTTFIKFVFHSQSP